MKTTGHRLLFAAVVAIGSAMNSSGYFDGANGLSVDISTAVPVATSNGYSSLLQVVPSISSSGTGRGMTLSLPAPGTLPTNNIPQDYLSLTNIELRTNAVLDELVKDYETNALALYLYVLNQIDLRSSPSVTNKSTRGALGSYLEKEGHDLDLCSLTIYLLRRCGIPCAYGFLPRPQMTAENFYQVYGYEPMTNGVGYYYYPNVTNAIVYAFVSTNGSSTNWISLVPWWKKRTFVEGTELREVLTNNYQTGLGIADHYLHRFPSLEQYITNSSDLTADLLPELLTGILASNAPSTSFDQVGVRWRMVEQTPTNWPTDYDIAVGSGVVITAVACLPDTKRDTVSMKLTKAGGGVLFSNTFYTCELHNRRVTVSFEPATNADWAKVTNGFYEAGTNFNMVGTLGLGPTPQSSTLVITGSLNQTVRMGSSVTMTIDGGQRTFSAGNYECYAFNFGRVTHEMLDQHYRVLDGLSRQTKAATNLLWSQLNARELLGEQLCTVGMNYYLLLDDASCEIEECTKTRSLGLSHVGSFFFNLATRGSSTFLADSMSIDAFSFRLNGAAYLHLRGSSSNGPYRNSEPDAQERDWFSLVALAGATIEHGVLEKSVGFTEAMSSDRCLRMAVEGGGYVTNLTASTYTNVQNQQIISNVDVGAYANVRTFFTNHPQGQLWFPSRQVTNGSYAGYGWVELDVNTNNRTWFAGYKIAGGNNGGRSQAYSEPAYQSTSWAQTGNNAVPVSATTPSQSLMTPSWNQNIVQIDYAGQIASRTVDLVATVLGCGSGSLTLDSMVGQAIWGADSQRMVSWNPAGTFFGSSQGSSGSAFSSQDDAVLRLMDSLGYYGGNVLGQGLRINNATVSDPVDTRTGEFYVDDLDLTVAGPVPIVFRRAYSSAYGAAGEFGFGWRFNHSCYLALGANETEIRAVEPDGSVLCYANCGANAWTVSVDLNQKLANENQRGIGSIANPFVNRIEKRTEAGSTNYVLTAADGQSRTYTVRSYNDGVVTRTRPYLSKWADANSNSLTYVYGTDSNRFDFGRITEIHNANHFVKMKYNSAGKLWQVLCDDGRVLQYEYSAAGDLASVKRPDGSFVYYEYEESLTPRNKTVETDGTNDYLELQRSLTNVQDSFTIEFWAKPTRIHEIDVQSTSGSAGTSGERYALYPDQGGATAAGAGVSVGINGVSVYEQGNSYMPALLVYTGYIGSTWAHIAVVYSNKTPTVYINGEFKASGLTSPRAHVFPGHYWGGGSYGSFAGQLDECRIWSYARSQAQVKATADSEVETNAAGLIGYWTFNDGVANDISTNANNATTYNGPSFRTDKTTYSTHLIVRETKPGGRVLENEYDDQRRVIAQRSTVGVSATPVQNATFAYLGDGENGTTIVSNILGATTSYVYTDGLIVETVDSLGFSETQDWDAARNLVIQTDKRGVTSRLYYDTRGNPTNVQLIGDVTGSGSITTSITWMTYTTNNLLASKTSPRGDVTRFYYDDHRNLTTQELCLADADPWNPTNNPVYRTDIFQCDVRGKITNTVIAAGTESASTNAFLYDVNGDLTQSRINPGYGESPVAYNYTRNPRGWVTQKTDGTGAYSSFDYDAIGRVTRQSDYASDGGFLGSTTYQYDENGNLLVTDGPRSSVDDSVLATYDRMNRMLSRTTHRYDVSFDDYAPVYTPAGISTYSWSFDDFGDLLQETDPNGNAARHSYDAQGQRIATTNYQGASTALSSTRTWYDEGGLVVSSRTARGCIVQTSYNALGKPVCKVHEDETTEQWHYDSANQPTQYINPRLIETRYQYDSFGRLTNRTEAAGTSEQRTYAFTYDLRGNCVTAENPEGLVSSNLYDRAGRLIAEMGPVGASPRLIWSNRYDSVGRLVARMGADSCVSNSYDGLGRLTNSASYRKGASSPDYVEDYSFSVYDLNDTRTTIYGGQECTDNYLDPAGRVGAVIYNDYTHKYCRYDAKGNLTREIDELERTNSYSYDGLDRVVAVTRPDGVTVTNQYDADGNVTNVLYPCGIQYQRTYDPRGRVTREVVTTSGQDALLNNSYGYDQNGNVVTQATARGITVLSSFDALDRKTGVTAAAPTPLIPAVSQTFTYSANGWIEEATDGDCTTARILDQQGRTISETNTANGSTLSFDQTFDGEGKRLSCHIGPGGESWSYQWNGAARVTNVYWAGDNYRLLYDSQRQLEAIQGWRVVLENSWGIRHTITHRSCYDEHSTYYDESATYRPDIQRTAHSIWYPGFPAIKTNLYAYDSLNQLTNEINYTGSGAWITNKYSYDSASLRTNFTKYTATGSWQRASVADSFHRLVAETTTAAGTNPVVTTSGQVLDSTNVLVRLNGAVIGYARVDTNSHVWTMSGVQLGGGSNVISVTADPDKTWATNASSTVTLNLYVRGSYVYDADGNLVYVNRGNRNYSYTFDALGRLVAAACRDGVGSGWNWTATYDAFNRRIRTTQANVTTNTPSMPNTAVTIWDPVYPMQEVYRQDQSNTLFCLYGPDLSDTIGGLGGIGGMLACRMNGTIRQVFGDMLGNTVGAIDNSAVDFNPLYSAFGVGGTLINLPSYSTRRYDDTGLIYFGARYYDQATGLFLSPDPSRFSDSRNPYALSGHNSINRPDPDGRMTSRNGASIDMLGISRQYGSFGTSTWEYDQNSTRAIINIAGAQVAFMGGAILGGEAAVPIFAAAGLSGGWSAFAAGMVAGASGDTFMQGFQIAVGDRSQFSGTEVLLSAALSGAAGYAGYAFSSPETTFLELDTDTTWGRAETLTDHFARHGADFGATTADEYANMASRFLQESQAAGFPTKIDSQGVIRIFDPETGTFGSFNPNGTTRTFFKPPNPSEYLAVQPGTLVP